MSGPSKSDQGSSKRGRRVQVLGVMAMDRAGLTGSPSTNGNGVRWPLFRLLSHHPLPSHICDMIAQNTPYRACKWGRINAVEAAAPRNPFEPPRAAGARRATFLSRMHPSISTQTHAAHAWKRSLLANGNMHSHQHSAFRQAGITPCLKMAGISIPNLP